MKTFVGSVCFVVAWLTAVADAVAHDQASEACLEGNGAPDALVFACGRALFANGNHGVTRATLLVRRAQLLTTMGRKREAERDIAAALDANPYSAGAYNLRGLIRHQAGATTGALADFAKSAELNPHFAEPLSQRAALLLQLNRTGTRDAVKAALAIDPDNTLAQMVLGAKAFGDRDFQAAALHFKAVLEGPRLTYPLAAFWYAAAVLRNGGNLEAAFEPYRWWWDVGGWPQALAELYTGKGDIKSAERAAIDAEHGGRMQTYFFVAQVMIAKGDGNTAVELLEKSLDGAPSYLLETIIARRIVSERMN
jgi:tetratricopeptide (TPR) repeat protein